MILITGLPAAGKTTTADQVSRLLQQHGRRASVLDGDAVREHLSAGLGFSDDDRRTNVLRVAWVGAQIGVHGGIALCSLVSPHDPVREEARRLVEQHGVRFALVHIATPLAECERRDPKGLYAKARRGELAGLTGVDDRYDPPSRPDLTIDTTRHSPEDAARLVVSWLAERGVLETEPAHA